MSDLFDGDVPLGEGGLLAVVTGELDAVLLVEDGVGGDRRVVAVLVSAKLCIQLPVSPRARSKAT